MINLVIIASIIGLMLLTPALAWLFGRLITLLTGKSGHFGGLRETTTSENPRHRGKKADGFASAKEATP